MPGWNVFAFPTSDYSSYGGLSALFYRFQCLVLQNQLFNMGIPSPCGGSFWRCSSGQGSNMPFLHCCGAAHAPQMCQMHHRCENSSPIDIFCMPQQQSFPGMSGMGCCGTASNIFSGFGSLGMGMNGMTGMGSWPQQTLGGGFCPAYGMTQPNGFGMMPSYFKPWCGFF